MTSARPRTAYAKSMRGFRRRLLGAPVVASALGSASVIAGVVAESPGFVWPRSSPVPAVPWLVM